jgi:cytochrome c oxidase subunit II
MNALRQPRFALAALATAGTVLGTFAYTLQARSQERPPQEITIKGDHFAFSPAEIVVHRDDLVKITFTAVDMPHSFTLDGFRIAKRAAAGQTVTFEFRADRPGSHDYYCNLSHDDRCRQMKGRLVVR